MVKYIILQAGSASALEEFVNRVIGEGWYPIGGVAIITQYTLVFCQAMILEK